MIKELPNDVSVEQAVLSTLLAGESYYGSVFGSLEPQDFYKQDHMDLYKILRAVHARGLKTDATTIIAASRGRFTSLIAELLSTYVSDSLIDQHAKLLKKISIDRQIEMAFRSGDKDKAKELLNMDRSFGDHAFFDSDKAIQETIEYRKRGSDPWVSTGWSELDKLYRIGTGQLSVVTGIPNSGKSNFMDALAVNLAKRENWNFIVYSPENLPVKRHIRSFAEKYSNFGLFEMSEEDVRINSEWVLDHFTFIDPDSINRNLESVLASVMKVLESKEINGVVIDPWNELEHSRPESMSETEYVGAALMRIRSFAIQNSLHIWIVAHPTKLHKSEDGEYAVPTPYDIAGSANWRNKPDNCITVYRYFKSGEVEIHVQKIRFKDFGRLGSVDMKYEPVTGRYSQVLNQ
jgi:hypothetical protein